MADTHTTTAGRQAQQIVARIWSDVLGRPVGPHDNFIDLGGSSLRAMTLVARLQDVFDCEMSIAVVLEYPTVTQLLGQLARLCGGAEVMASRAEAWLAKGTLAAKASA